MTNLERKINAFINHKAINDNGCNFSAKYDLEDIDPNKYYAFKLKEDGTLDKSDAIKDKKGYDSKIEAEQAISDKPNCTVVRGSTLITQYTQLFK